MTAPEKQMPRTIIVWNDYDLHVELVSACTADEAQKRAQTLTERSGEPDDPRWQVVEGHHLTVHVSHKDDLQ